MTTSPVPSITDEDIAEIEWLAAYATQGPWHHETSAGQVGSVDVGDLCLAQAQQLNPRDNAHRDCNAAYIASVYPQVVVALIARLRAAEKDAERFRWIAENADVDCRGHAPEGDYESLGCRIDAAMTEAKP